MERRKDTPFFVGKNVEDRRHGLRLIHGSGEEPADYESRRKADGNQYLETIVELFLRESGLGPEDFEKSTVDLGLLEEEFTNFIKSKTEDATFKERKFLAAMTFPGVAYVCEIWAQESLELIRSLPKDVSEEIRAEAFFAARYHRQINMIMQEAVSMTATQKAASRNIVIVQPDKNPTESS